MANQEIDSSQIPDDELVVLARDGNMDAYSILYQRHRVAATHKAASLTNKVDADDLVSEAFVKVLRSLKNGAGPTENFKNYLLTSVESVAKTQGSKVDAQPRSSFDDESEMSISPSIDVQEMSVERLTTFKAFSSLPTKWQQILWYRDIEELQVKEIAKLLNITPNTVTQTLIRAHEGLKQEWIKEQLTVSSNSPDCQWLKDHAGKYSRNKLSLRDQRTAESHLANCKQCSGLIAEAGRLNSRLAVAIIPLMLGGTAGIASYISGGKGVATAAVTSAAATKSSGLSWISAHYAASPGKFVATAAGSATGVAAIAVASVILLAPPSPESVEIPQGTFQHSPSPTPTPTPAPTEEVVPQETIAPVDSPQVAETFLMEAAGGALPGTYINVQFSDGSSQTVVADSNGRWLISVIWDAQKPNFTFTATPVLP